MTGKQDREATAFVKQNGVKATRDRAYVLDHRNQVTAADALHAAADRAEKSR